LTVEFTAKVRLQSQINTAANWRARAAQVKAQRRLIGLLWLANRPRGALTPHPPFVVTLTRIGPRPVDDDNLRGAFKAPRDELAACLGVDDGDTASVTWVYAQERGLFGIRVKIQARDPIAGIVTAA
jgi:hypothetical protein